MKTNKALPKGDAFFDELVDMLNFVFERDPERAAALVGEFADEMGVESDPRATSPLVQP